LHAQRSNIFKIIPQDSVTEKVQVSDAVSNVAAAVCGTPITPACIKSLYNINYTAEASGNLIAFSSYLKYYARYADLQSFETQYAPSAKGQNFSVQLINGATNDQTSTQASGKGLSSTSSCALYITIDR
jgi:tripeptidyl-peptidase I